MERTDQTEDDLSYGKGNKDSNMERENHAGTRKDGRNWKGDDKI